MGSTRAGAGGGGADLLTSAAALRWARPDLTAAIADHVLEAAAIAGDQDRWLAAAGWAVHARSATGDGRETASDVMGSLSRWGRAPLDGPAARRLRVELALVAAGAGEVETARGLLGPVEVDESEPELRADLLCVLARCAVEDAPGEVAGALRTAAAAWSAVRGPGRRGRGRVGRADQRRGRTPQPASRRRCRTRCRRADPAGAWPRLRALRHAVGAPGGGAGGGVDLGAARRRAGRRGAGRVRPADAEAGRAGPGQPAARPPAAHRGAGRRHRPGRGRQRRAPGAGGRGRRRKRRARPGVGVPHRARRAPGADGASRDGPGDAAARRRRRAT